MVTMMVLPQDKGGGPTVTRSKHAPPSKPLAEDPNETGSLTPPRSQVGKSILKMMDNEGPTAATKATTTTSTTATTASKIKKKTKKFSPKRLWNLRSGKSEHEHKSATNKFASEEVATDSQEDIEDVDNYNDKEEIVDFDSPGKSELGSSTIQDLEERYDVDHLSGDDVSGLKSMDDEDDDDGRKIHPPPKSVIRRDRNSWEAAGLKSTPPDYVSITTGSMIDATHDTIEVGPRVLFRSVPEQETAAAVTKGNTTKVSSSSLRPRRFGFLGWFWTLVLVDIILVGVYYGQGFDFKFLKDSKAWEEEIIPLANKFSSGIIDDPTTFQESVEKPLKGLVAVVVGGTSTRIGQNIAEALSILGAQTVVVDNKRLDPSVAIEELANQTVTMIMEADLTNVDAVSAVATQITREFRQIDILIDITASLVSPVELLRARITREIRQIDTLIDNATSLLHPVELFHEAKNMLVAAHAGETNYESYSSGSKYLAHVILSQKLLPYLEKSKHGTILHVASDYNRLLGNYFELDKNLLSASSKSSKGNDWWRFRFIDAGYLFVRRLLNDERAMDLFSKGLNSHYPNVAVKRVTSGYWMGPGIKSILVGLLSSSNAAGSIGGNDNADNDDNELQGGFYDWSVDAVSSQLSWYFNTLLFGPPSESVTTTTNTIDDDEKYSFLGMPVTEIVEKGTGAFIGGGLLLVYNTLRHH